ncbi:MAG: squalene/phytoene synthase family protein [Geminicoccaceae bacterium]
MNDRRSNLLGALREGDPDRYLVSLFVPAEWQEPVAALFVLNLELARIREATTLPVTGLMRLQWWRERLEAVSRQAQSSGHPVLGVLAELLAEGRFQSEDLLSLVDARETEFDASPLASVAELEAFAQATAGHLARLSGSVQGAPDGTLDALTAAGTAYGILGVLKALPFAMSQGVAPFAPELSPSTPVSAAPPALLAFSRQAAERGEALLRASQVLRASQGDGIRAVGLIHLLAGNDFNKLQGQGFDPTKEDWCSRPPWTILRAWAHCRLGW